MSDASLSASAREINTQASLWLERVHAGAWSGEDQTALDAWLAQSHLHRAAYWRLEAAWSDASRLAALKLSHFPEEDRRSAPILKIAAAIAVIAALGVAGMEYLRTPPTQTYMTSVGGRELVRFADGTQIELNTDTVLRSRMTTNERTVWLDRGEAYFRVRHDAAHPFTVMIGERRITDLGTEFLVQRNAAQTQIAVMQGKVRFDAPDVQSPLKTATLTPGDVALASGNAMSVTKKSRNDLSNSLEWRRGVLVFRHTALADAVSQFNRYNVTKLVITDPAAARMSIGGEFRTDNLEDFMRAMQVVLGLHVRRNGQDIEISR